MVPTPCKANGEGWDVSDSVDLDETARMTEKYVSAGIGLIAACGTTGECAALLWEEKKAFVDAIVQVNRKRVPVFAGATALGTKRNDPTDARSEGIGSGRSLCGPSALSDADHLKTRFSFTLTWARLLLICLFWFTPTRGSSNRIFRPRSEKNWRTKRAL
jgi:hypothetical protein